MNTLANASTTALASLQDLTAGLQNVQTALPKIGMDPILRMQKDGDWVYGQENTLVEADQVWAINPYAISHGWIAWRKRPEGSTEPAKVLGERMVSMTQRKPAESELEELTEPGRWTEQVGLMLRGFGGADDGIQVQYKTNSVGGTRAANTLITAILDQVRVDPSKPVPLVKLTHETYIHKAHGKIYNPVLSIVGWTDMDGTAVETGEVVEDDVPFETAPQPAPQPAPQTAAAAAAAPVRRRR
jgi:hypothetical protein